MRLLNDDFCYYTAKIGFRSVYLCMKGKNALIFSFIPLTSTDWGKCTFIDFTAIYTVVHSFLWANGERWCIVFFYTVCSRLVLKFRRKNLWFLKLKFRIKQLSARKKQLKNNEIELKLVNFVYFVLFLFPEKWITRGKFEKGLSPFFFSSCKFHSFFLFSGHLPWWIWIECECE